MKKLLVTILFSLLLNCVFAQSSFYKVFIENKSSGLNASITVNSSLFLSITKLLNDTIAYSQINKYAITGNLVDSIILDEVNFNGIHHLIKVDNNKILGVGKSYNYDLNVSTTWVILFDTSLNILENNNYIFDDYGIALLNHCKDADGNILIFGCNSADPANSKEFFFRINQIGDSIDFKWIDFPGLEYAMDILKGKNGYYCFLESQYFNQQPSINTYNQVVKFTYDLEVDTFFSLLPSNKNSAFWLTDSTFVASGHKKLYQFDSGRYLGVVEMDTLGNVLNEFWYGKEDTVTQPGAFQNLVMNHNKEMYLGGIINFNIYVNPTDTTWIVINKLDSNLNLQWQKFIGGDNYYMLWTLDTAADGGCYLFGSRWDFAHPENKLDLMMAKIGPNGEFLSSPEIPHSLMEVKIYPNPGRDYFMLDVRLPEQKNRIELFDLNGKACLYKEIQNGNNTINTQNLPTGMYVFKIFTKEKEILSGRWVKN
ncbi:MAG: T9SS type A sorting domain-containing protein [Bacteroidales bacterium]|nr:T9SS type A sorting domain-containing protein [Bacteroidales bacterium]MCF8456744.1 T9SS type A sorting domain-containing protein [Bacteroidales bacterium]